MLVGLVRVTVVTCFFVYALRKTGVLPDVTRKNNEIALFFYISIRKDKKTDIKEGVTNVVYPLPFYYLEIVKTPWKNSREATSSGLILASAKASGFCVISSLARLLMPTHKPYFEPAFVISVSTGGSIKAIYISPYVNYI